MQNSKTSWKLMRMRTQCVPGALSLASAWVRSYIVNALGTPYHLAAHALTLYIVYEYHYGQKRHYRL